MAGITDRNGRKIRMILYDNKGNPKELDQHAFNTVHRIRQNIPRITGSSAGGYSSKLLCDKAIKKIMGMAPEKIEIKFKNKKRVFLMVPKDLGNFIRDISSIIKDNQYNVVNLKNTVVIDAGANIGIFSLYAYACGAKKIYAFEPVSETYEILKKNINLNHLEKMIVPVNIALGKKTDTVRIKYNIGGEGSAMIEGSDIAVNKNIRYKNTRDIKVIALDSFISGRVGFIKIDVEGYEENVLSGAGRIIRKYKPVLSFSAYHRPADKKTLPKTVLSIRDDYKITLNTFAEHDFYCE
ncbi:MAG: FkbM family methyltransferase [Elusimicrobia bacterium]|nr:FkbM family methyltransferase [Elusimicrobiota bacterium]